MKHLIKQLEQLQQTAERDHENSELLCYHVMEVERQKWEACEARLTVQLEEAMQQIVLLREQSVRRENIRPPRLPEGGDELEKREFNLVAPPTASHASSDGYMLSESLVDISETSSEVNAETQKTLKPAVITTVPRHKS